MQKRSHTNVLLVEILIALFFFMLSSVVLIQVFSTAHNMTEKASIRTRALAEAQNVADSLKAAEDREEMLAGLQFSNAHDAWMRRYDGFTLYVELEEEQFSAGIMRKGSLYAFCNENGAGRENNVDELFSLPLADYRGE